MNNLGSLSTKNNTILKMVYNDPWYMQMLDYEWLKGDSRGLTCKDSHIFSGVKGYADLWKYNKK